MSEKIIYLKGDPTTEKISLPPKRPRKSFGWFLSRFLMVGGLATFLLFVSPFLLMESRWRLDRLENQPTPEQEAILRESGFGKIIRTTDYEILQPANSHFSVIIPKIGVNSTVFANIPIEDKEKYESVLKNGVAHAAGTYLPGEKGSIYIFGHSTDYVWNVSRINAVFYLLKNLDPEDQINVFYQGKRYTYRIVDKKIVAAEDPELLHVQSGRERLVLLTCWPPGTVWKRLAIFAERV